MQFIDTHLHLDSEAFDDDRHDVIEASRDKGVTRWINVGYNPYRWDSTEQLVRSIAGMHCMLGLHPGDADAWSEDVATALTGYIDRLRPVAIGEIGLDLYWRQDNLSRQIEVFRAQLGIARQYELPVVIHMRDANDEILGVLDGGQDLPHIHFHSFDGDASLQEWVLRHGATIGVGGLLTRKGSEPLQQWVKGLPRDRVVLETDAPYLKPRGIRGKRNEPAYMVKVGELLARLWELPLKEVATLTTANARRIFHLDEGSGSCHGFS